MARPLVQPGSTWATHVRAEAAPGLTDVLAAGGLDLTQARTDTTPAARDLPRLTARLDIVGTSVTAPNTVGVLEGSDPKLKDEYIVFSAHMGHIGISSGQSPDSINNGANDNASGMAGVLELAEAFARPEAQPRRSILFVTVSGEEKGLWGSAYFTAHLPVPKGQIVANLNIDGIGRNILDSIVVIGQEYSDLGATPDRVAAAHPELRMAPMRDRWPEEGYYARSDQYHFARRGIPILFFMGLGSGKDYHAVTDSRQDRRRQGGADPTFHLLRRPGGERR